MICLCSDEKPGQGLAQHLIPGLFRKRRFRIVRSVGDGGLDMLIELRIGPATARRKSLVAGYRYKPCRDGRAPFEPASLTPHVQKDFAQKVFGKRRVVDEANEPSINGRAVSGKQRFHGAPVAESNPFNEQLVS